MVKVSVLQNHFPLIIYDLLSHLFEELLFLLMQLFKKTFLAHIERSARLPVRVVLLIWIVQAPSHCQAEPHFR